MKTFKVSRVFCARHTWTVDAENEAEALAMLDDTNKTPNGAEDETWLGTYGSITDDYEDKCELVSHEAL
jgi:hypothetical protein